MSGKSGNTVHVTKPEQASSSWLGTIKQECTGLASVLYLGWRCTGRSSSDPWANCIGGMSAVNARTATEAAD